jgi:4-carboxymuconolactone decarboxylase
MPRIPIIERADMNAEQARVYDAAKQGSGIVGGPYYAYIRLPKLFEAAQNLRESLSGGPLSQREQQIVNLVVARHWNARYPWFAQVRRSLSVGIDQAVIDAINAHKTPSLPDPRERTCFVVAHELLANKGLSDATYAAAEKAMGLESLVALVASIGSFSMTCMTAGTFGIEPPAANPTPLAQ